ncbi:MAG: Rieske (2Fe-2S) protein [Gammaproteobacteria bacterium]|nr:Rieske (2Fe-2S) protein [Gammaproteobacteria bacterium]NVK88041.1 Rieske (2Fe-2S) protein [Gammaproteobacteria bacterium]
MTYLCALNELSPYQPKIIALSMQQSCIVVQTNQQVNVFLNQCPHAAARLNFDSDAITALDGYHLYCQLHGAQFDPQTGYCSRGPCQGQSLTQLPCQIIEQQLYLVD